jgi:hypothetical protein
MKAVRRVTLFVLASMIVNFVICMQVATAEQRYPKALEKGQHARSCEFQGQQFNQGVIVIAGVHRQKLVKQQCSNGRWIAFSPNDREADGLLTAIQNQAEGLSGYNCDQRGGCHCRGDDSCRKLFESGKCRGPITCNPNNPQDCRCP